jgi:CRP-like cAMP-binding protein
MFFVLEGKLSVSKNNKELSTISSGDFFGEMGLLTKNNRNATISAKTPSLIFEIDREAFKVVLEKETNIVEAVKTIINERKSNEHLITEVDKVSSESRESLFKKFKDIFGVGKT